MTSAYLSLLVAQLTVPQSVHPFDTVTELNESDAVVYAPIGLLERLSFIYDPTFLSHFSTNETSFQHMSAACDVLEVISNEFQGAGEPHYLMKERLTVAPLGLMIKPIFTKKFRRFVLLVQESGIWLHWREREESKLKVPPETVETDHSENKIFLNFDDLKELFVLHLYGHLLATLVLLLEIAINFLISQKTDVPHLCSFLPCIYR